MKGGRLRLLMTVDTVGGVWQYATDLATALAAWDVETVLVVLGPAATAQQRADAIAIPGLELIDTGLPLEWLADAPEAVLAAGLAIAAIAAERRVDLVQLNQPALAAPAPFAMPSAPPPPSRRRRDVPMRCPRCPRWSTTAGPPCRTRQRRCTISPSPPAGCGTVPRISRRSLAPRRGWAYR